MIVTFKINKQTMINFMFLDFNGYNKGINKEVSKM